MKEFHVKKRINIRKKLLMLLGTISILLPSFIYTNFRVKNEYLEIIEKKKYILELEKDIQALSYLLDSYVLESIRNNKEEKKAQISQIRYAIDKNLSALNQEEKIAKYIKEDITHWTTGIKPMIELIIEVDSSDVELASLFKLIAEFKIAVSLHARKVQKEFSDIVYFSDLLRLGVISASLFLFSFIFFNIIALSKRLKDLSEKLQDFSNGDKDIHFEVRYDDEIGMVQKTLAQMQFELTREVKSNEEILSEINDALMICDGSLNILKINPKVRSFFAYDEDEILGKNVADLVSKSDEAYSYFSKFNSEFSMMLSDVKLIGKTKNHLDLALIASVQKIDEQEDGRVLVTFRDGRDSELLKELKDKTAQLVQASKLASLGEMAGGIAHEINNPLAVIIGQMGILSKAFDKGKLTEDRFKQAMDKINKTLKKVTQIIESVRRFSSGSTSTDKEPVTLVELIDETMDICNQKLRNEKIYVKQDLHNKDELLFINKVELSQVVLNILSNAHDSMIENQVENREIKIYSEVTEETVRLFIRNTGPGIPSEIRDKIMEPFFTTKSVGKGTGMGLSISHGLCKRNNVLFYLTKEEQTCFVLEFDKYTQETKAA